MNRLASILVIAVIGLAVLTAAGPALTHLVQSITPLVLVIGIVAAALRVVWFYTR
jgi:hypothetical protein